MCCELDRFFCDKFRCAYKYKEILTTEESSSSINGSVEMEEERAKISEGTPVTPSSDTIIGKTT